HRLARREVKVHREPTRCSQVDFADAGPSLESEVFQPARLAQQLEGVGQDHLAFRDLQAYSALGGEELDLLLPQHRPRLPPRSEMSSRSGTLTSTCHSWS